MKKKISLNDRFFVAGATGMVGSAICKALKSKGYGNDQKGGEILKPQRIDLNLLNYDDVNKWFELNQPSVVVLAAAKVGGIYANSKYPYNFLIENLKIQNNIIEASWRHGVKRFMFLGSSCIYPKFAEQPIKEESLLTGSLESTNEPYALAKITGMKLCESLRIQHGFDAITLMPTNLYGTGDNFHPQNSHVMASLIKKFTDAKLLNLSSVICWGSGSPMREFLHVNDLAEAIIFTLEQWDPLDENSPKDSRGYPLFHLNVGTGKDISIKDLALLIKDLAEFKGEIIWDKSKPDGTKKKQLDIKRIQNLGWFPKIKLRRGIKETLHYYKSNYYSE